MKAMMISKFARSAGVGVETIRFYERKGLIDQPPKPLDAGFRVYPEETVQRLRFIRKAQEIGFSLREIDELLSLRADPSADSSDVRERSMVKLEDINRKIAHLEEIRDALEDLIAACPGRGALRVCSIMELLAAASEGTAASPDGERNNKE